MNTMAARSTRLSRERIVDAAIGILDADGEAALTFRTLAARLQTGPGALYWHIPDKNELLKAATDDIITGVMSRIDDAVQPRDGIRDIAVGVFDAIDAHPWVGTQLTREPWQTAVLQFFEGIGARLQAFGVPRQHQFNAASALVNYILGLAGQYAAGARLLSPDTDRTTFLGTVAEQWSQHDPTRYPFVHQAAGELPGHDDRE
ncbi:MAG: Transcriptional regulator, TetR family, partial [Mycobacterium sp.]|nr:Transcriptional regulator, TetR family [Mycobacterium sp.]